MSRKRSNGASLEYYTNTTAPRLQGHLREQCNSFRDKANGPKMLLRLQTYCAETRVMGIRVHIFDSGAGGCHEESICHVVPISESCTRKGDVLFLIHAIQGYFGDHGCGFWLE